MAWVFRPVTAESELMNNLNRHFAEPWVTFNLSIITFLIRPTQLGKIGARARESFFFGAQPKRPAFFGEGQKRKAVMTFWALDEDGGQRGEFIWASIKLGAPLEKVGKQSYRKGEIFSSFPHWDKIGQETRDLAYDHFCLFVPVRPTWSTQLPSKLLIF